MVSLIALMSAILGMSLLSSAGENLSSDETQEPETDPLPDQEILPDEYEDMSNIGATFLETGAGVMLELGEDETGSLAVVYYTDTEDDAEDWLEVDEARFYLVPEGVDWSDASWETQGNVPGAQESGGAWNYELEDFEAHFELELLGVVDLKGVPSASDDPASRVGEIDANAPVDGYYLEANTDGDELVSFLPDDYVVTRNGVPETQVAEDTTGSDGSDWLSTDVAGVVIDGANGDDILVSSAADVTLLGGEGNDTIEDFSGNSITIDAGNGDDSVRADSSVIDLGAGDDYAEVNGGTVHGGNGADVVYGSGYAGRSSVTLYGEAGDDLVTVYGDGADDVAFGGEGNDTVSAYGGGVANGGEGDDLVRVDPGSQAFGDSGDDFISVYNGVRDDDGPATLTGGDGQDTIEASIANFGGENEGVFAVVTDFEPDEDVLILKAHDSGSVNLQNVTLTSDAVGGFTDVHLEYTWNLNSNPGTAIVRLNGVTDLSLSQLDIRT